MRVWRNKTVFITGGSSGIGFALAAELAEAGAKLVLIARDRGKLEKAKEKLLELYNSADIRILPADISDKEKLDSALSRPVLESALPDLLIN